MRAVKESSPLINFSATKHHDDDRLKAKKSVHVVHHPSKWKVAKQRVINVVAR